eukprot:2016694-Ditylum_brightwellii.AAC.1
MGERINKMLKALVELHHFDNTSQEKTLGAFAVKIKCYALIEQSYSDLFKVAVGAMLLIR